MYPKLLILSAIFFMKTESYLIESPSGEEDACNFQDRRLAESVRLVRSKYNCRVFYICAFYKQYSLICAEGLYFDQDSNSCNYQEIVKCELSSHDLKTQDNPNTFKLIDQNQGSENQSNQTELNFYDFNFMNQTNFSINETEEVIFSTNSYQGSNLTEIDFANEIGNGTITSTDNIKTSTIIHTSTSSIAPTQIVADKNNWWHGPSECIEGFEHKLAHKENCALYFECTKKGEKIPKACPYPLQYDEMLNECRFYDLIECGRRKQAKDLCIFFQIKIHFNHFFKR